MGVKDRELTPEEETRYKRADNLLNSWAEPFQAEERWARLEPVLRKRRDTREWGDLDTGEVYL